MELGGFSSYFELFVVFNFVYYGTQEFRFTLTQTIFRGEKHLEEITDSSESIYKLLLLDLGEQTEVGKTIELFVTKDTSEIVDRLNKSKTSFEIERNSIIENFKSNCIIKSFPKYCLLSALFCLSILLLIGIFPSINEVNYPSFYSSLLLVSVLVLISFLAAFFNDTIDNINLRVEKIYNVHIIIFFLILILIGLGNYYLSVPISWHSFNFDIQKIAISLSIIAVCIHFIVYLFRYFFVYRKHRRKAFELNKKVKEQVNDIDPKLINASQLVRTIMEGNLNIEKENS